MSSPAAKRRRVEKASIALSRPFRTPVKSPLKTPLKQNVNTSNQQSGNDVENDPSCSDVDSPAAAKVTRHVSSTPKERTTPCAPLLSGSRQGLSAYRTTSTDPDILAAEKHQRQLESHARSLRTDVDLLTQALSIERSGRDEKLQALTMKWRAASRRAAEELFPTIQERVMRMGGVAGWHERENDRSRWRQDGGNSDSWQSWGWDNSDLGRKRQESDELLDDDEAPRETNGGESDSAEADRFDRGTINSSTECKVGPISFESYSAALTPVGGGCDGYSNINNDRELIFEIDFHHGTDAKGAQY